MATPFSLELRDVKTSQTMLVPPEGLVFGREGGDADVTFRDAGISKRHARVFAEGGTWMLEDLGSSNGTWLKGQRINQPVRLSPGDTFHLNKQQLQVMQVVAPTSAGAPTYGDVPQQTGVDGEEEAVQDEPTPKPQPRPAAARAGDSQRGAERSGAARVGSQPPPGKRPPPAMLRPAPEDLPEEPMPEPHEDEPMPEDEGLGGDEAAQDVGSAADQLKSKGIGYFFVAVPKAIAFYLAAVPVMLFNPVGTIRNGPKKMKFEAMGPMELIPYALVPGLLGAAMGFIGSVIAQLIGMIAYHGSLAIGGLISMLIVGPIVAVVVAVITGFIFHPVLNWIVKFLKGTSDPKSRTNYFIQAQTAAVLVQVPSALVPIMAMIHLPLIGVVPLVVSFACTLITLFVSYTWFIHFKVVKWFQYVILAVGALAALGTLAGLPAAIRGAPSVPSGATVASAEEVQAQMEASQKKAEELAKMGPAAQQKALAAAAEAAKHGKPAKDAVAAAEANPPGVEEIPIDQPKAKEPPKKAEEPKAEPKEEPKEEVAAKTPPPAAEPSAPSGGYAKWNAHRAAIEKELTDDPIKLMRIDGLLPMYKQYEQHRYDAEQKWGKATAKKPSEARVNEHLRDAELFKETDAIVQGMWERLGH